MASTLDTTQSIDLASDTLGPPWRHTVDWDDLSDIEDKFRSELEEYIPLGEDLQDSNVRFPCTNILLFGPSGTGKSAFINTATSAFRGKIFNVARSGMADRCITTKFTKYPIKSTPRQPMNFRLCDTRGVQKGSLMTSENMRMLLEGCLVDKFAFEPSTNVSPSGPGYKRSPNLDEKMHCVAIFVDACALDTMEADIVQNIKEMQIVMNSLDVPQVAILTNVDKACEKTDKDVTQVYRSAEIEKRVKKACETFGLPEYNVFPMKNYEKEGRVETSINVLLMYTLKMILDQADAYLYNQYDEIVSCYEMNGRE